MHRKMHWIKATIYDLTMEACFCLWIINIKRESWLFVAGFYFAILTFFLQFCVYISWFWHILSEMWDINSQLCVIESNSETIFLYLQVYILHFWLYFSELLIVFRITNLNLTQFWCCFSKLQLLFLKIVSLCNALMKKKRENCEIKMCNDIFYYYSVAESGCNI